MALFLRKMWSVSFSIDELLDIVVLYDRK